MPNGDIEHLYDMLAENKIHARRADVKGKYFLMQSFKKAGELFKVFEDNTSDLIVPYNKEADTIICDLCSQKAKFDYVYMKERLEKAKMYTIQVFEYQKKKLEEQGMLFSDGGQHFMALNSQCYNSEIGLEIEKFIF